MGDVINNLSVSRSRKIVVDKLLELGLVGDRKDLRKKRQKKDGTTKDRQQRKSGNDLRELSDVVSDEHSSSDGTHNLSREMFFINTLEIHFVHLVEMHFNDSFVLLVIFIFILYKFDFICQIC